MAKINISIDDELLAKTEKLANQMYMTKSGIMTLALTQFIAQNAMVNAITDMSVTMRRIADEGQIDDSSRKELEDFERLVKLLTQSK